MQVNPPFPPYSEVACRRRFPDDLQAQQRLLLLTAALVDRQSRAALSQQYGLSQARISQLIQHWTIGGVHALLGGRRADARPVPPDPATLRRFIPALATHTSFHIGISPTARSWATHIRDPAQRGLWVVSQIEHALAVADAALHQRYMVPPLLTHHLRQNVPISALTHRFALSRSRLYALLHEGLRVVCQVLADSPITERAPVPWAAHLLQEPLVGRERELAALQQRLAPGGSMRLVGLPGIGKSTLAAAIAEAWSQAGWNVCWIASTATSFAVEHLLVALGRFAAAQGLVQQTHADTSYPMLDRVSHLAELLHQLPVLVILDDVHLHHRSVGWQASIKRLCTAAPALRVLLVGRECHLEQGPLWYLEGLSQRDAVTLYDRSLAPAPATTWDAVYRLSAGNPKFLHLLRRNPEIAAAATHDVTHFLAACLARLPSAAQDLLLWLCWWEQPISRQHPFIQAAQGQPSAWGRLLQQHLITTHNEQISVHDVLRGQLRSMLPPDTWESVRLRVLSYAEQNGDLPLAYRCVAAVRDGAAQLRLSRAIAQAAEQSGEPLMAQHWWVCYRELCEAHDDRHGAAAARLAEAETLLHLVRPTEALAILAPLDDHADPTIRWWSVLLRVEAQRLLGNTETMTALLAAAPLCESAPAGIGAAGHWRLQFQHSVNQSRRGAMGAAWHAYLTLGPPPPGTPLHLIGSYARHGAMLALEQGDHRRCRQLSQYYLRHARTYGQMYSRCAAQIEWARMLYAQERHSDARRLLQQTLQEIATPWVSLRWLATSYLALAECALGNLRAAQHAWEQSEAACAALSPGNFAGFAGLIRVVIALTQNDVATAAGQLEIAAQVYEQMENESQLGVVRFWQAQIALQQGEISLTAQHFQHSLRCIRRHKLRNFLLHFRLAWSEYCVQIGAPARAYRHARHTELAAQAATLPILEAQALTVQAEALLALDRAEAALGHVQRAAVLIQSKYRHLAAAPRTFAVYARCLSAVGQTAAAHTAWQAVRDELAYQITHLPPHAQIERFLQHPHLRATTAHFGGAEHLLKLLRRRSPADEPFPAQAV